MRMGALGRAIYNGKRRYRVTRDEIVPEFTRLGGDLAGCRVLEVGAGRGAGAELVIEHLGAARVDVVDLDPLMTRLASSRLVDRPAGVILADSTALPVATGRYDAVVDFGGIHLADDWRAILAEIARVLRPGGRFYIEQPLNPVPVLAARLPSGGRLPRGFARDELLAAMAAVGLDTIATGSRGLGRHDLLGVARKRR
jgi:ubiquinone/menaquinone biosynthesis C-methylase UbiE